MSESKTLLQQIEEEAVDSKSDVAALLRKCQVLATRLHNDSLKDWIWHELNGYPHPTDIPEYRIVPCQSVGTFYGLGKTLKNAPIPPMCVPEEARDVLFTLHFTQGAGTLQALLADTDGTVIASWPSDLVALLSQKVYHDMGMINAHMECSSSAIVKILETIRNRILDFVLALEEDCPSAGEPIGSTKLDEKKIDQMVTNNIFKGVGNLALQCGTVSQTNTVNVEKGNWALLENFLREIKIEKERIDELKDILQQEPPKSKEQFGTRLSQWIGSICAKAASGMYSIPFAMISGVLTTAICKYFGWV